MQHAETAEGLAKNTPALDVQLIADELSVSHDRIRTEVGQVVSLCFRAHPLESCDRGRPAGAALVKHEHSELFQGAPEPAWCRRMSRRARRLHARSALQEDKERSIAPVRCRDLPRKYGDLLAARIRVAQRHVKLKLRQHQSWWIHSHRHR